MYQYKTDNREPGIGNRQLVPCSLFDKTSRIFQNCKNRKRGIGNRERETSSLFWYIRLMFQKCKSGIRNQFPVPYLL